jgi:heptosyltransferase III
MVPDAIPLSAVSRVLVTKLRHHGDVLLSTPVFSALRQALPESSIDALVYRETAPMLEGHPAIRRIHGIDREWKHLGLVGQTKAERQLLAALREGRYDLVVHLTEHRRGAWLVRLLGTRWAVAPQRPGRFWRGSFTHFYPGSHPRRHTVETNLDALRRIGIQPPADVRRLVLQPGPAAEARARELMAAHGLLPGGFVHLHPGSRWLFKCWPAESFAALADALHERKLRIVLTAAPDPAEAALIAHMRSITRCTPVDLSGQLSLKELAALTAQARLFVGVDSAPMHIAAAMGTPTVALFGPSGDMEWGPWCDRKRVVASSTHTCRPCGRDGCGGGKISECLTTLPVAQVLAACLELLGS